ncbi:MAG: GatB/YqeY domain-containing protein [Parcubacteria group bacterium]|nr:GatB/YqeY domain-containing protein [Parcubacteria group bacterium]
MLHEQIKKEAQVALKTKNASLLKALRNIIAALSNEATAKGKTPSGILTDEETVAVITRLAKQRKESIEQFEKGGRPELAAEEREELEHLQKYLPEMMSEDEVRKIIFSKKEALGIPDKSKMGTLIGVVMKELKGKADGAMVKKIVEKSFE